MDKATLLNVAANTGKKGVGTKTLPVMTGSHPMPSGRKSITLF